MSDPFAPEIVAAVLKHMNTDHADHSLGIVHTLGGRPDATAVELTELDPDGAVFTAEVADGNRVQVRVPWSETITERPQFRAEFARMHREAARAAHERSGSETR
ncbi:DUF2470 domain-containing protein [Kribbella speibonae]|uniref:DUF2470 domain-containing protein n=1 Tax=Kribbella speibonae TaxID=1572660 RepID=A0A4R0II90_9ACTN|nr:DUF2470 domain-containing protein [Kribbella speibonae]TCC24658.1 DUF2470 domain-containing protein [Kribbella speibonae]TCC30926.1 DUF2470 domain-containing protein [Kribbella speibonae]